MSTQPEIKILINTYLTTSTFNVINEDYHDDPKQHQCQVTTC